MIDRRLYALLVIWACGMCLRAGWELHKLEIIKHPPKMVTCTDSVCVKNPHYHAQ